MYQDKNSMPNITSDMKTQNVLLQMPPSDLYIWLQNTFVQQIPTSLETADQLKSAGNRLGKLTNIYSYLISMLTFANFAIREKKRNKEDKDIVNEMIDRRDAIQNTADVVKMQYTAISRMITVKKQADEEIRML